jgi:N utilization substance protein A
MKSEFALAFNEITERFGLSRETVMAALEAAMVSAYRRSVNASTAQSVEARVDPETGEVHMFAEKEIVDGVQSPQTEASLEARRNPRPPGRHGHGRLDARTSAAAAQTASR